MNLCDLKDCNKLFLGLPRWIFEGRQNLLHDEHLGSYATLCILSLLISQRRQRDSHMQLPHLLKVKRRISPPLDRLKEALLTVQAIRFTSVHSPHSWWPGEWSETTPTTPAVKTEEGSPSLLWYNDASIRTLRSSSEHGPTNQWFSGSMLICNCKTWENNMDNLPVTSFHVLHLRALNLSCVNVLIFEGKARLLYHVRRDVFHAPLQTRIDRRMASPLTSPPLRWVNCYAP